MFVSGDDQDGPERGPQAGEAPATASLNDRSNDAPDRGDEAIERMRRRRRTDSLLRFALVVSIAINVILLVIGIFRYI